MDACRVMMFCEPRLGPSDILGYMTAQHLAYSSTRHSSFSCFFGAKEKQERKKVHLHSISYIVHKCINFMPPHSSDSPPTLLSTTLGEVPV